MRANGRSESANMFLTYCKAVGVLVAAASGIVGVVISIATAYREPTENLAKQSYKIVQETVQGLSKDLQKGHDSNQQQHVLIEKDISSIRGEMKLVVQLLESIRSRWPSQPAQVLRDLRTKVGKASAVKSGKAPTNPRPPTRTLPSISNVQQQARAAFE